VWQSRHILMSRVRAEGDDVEVFSERWLGPVGVNMDFKGEEGDLLVSTFRPISVEQPVRGSAQTTRPQMRQ